MNLGNGSQSMYTFIENKQTQNMVSHIITNLHAYMAYLEELFWIDFTCALGELLQLCIHISSTYNPMGGFKTMLNLVPHLRFPPIQHLRDENYPNKIIVSVKDKVCIEVPHNY